jgi:hypothetical protein
MKDDRDDKRLLKPAGEILKFKELPNLLTDD